MIPGRRHFCLGCAGLALGSLATAAAGQWSPPLRFARPDDTTDEGGLWGLFDREEARLRRSAFLIRDPALNAYVRDIACRLAGDHCPDLRVYLVRTPHFNASMAPNGMMQVWSGLLLRAGNEAQLAAVLGHEIGHYYARHGLERLRDARSRAAFAQFLGFAFAAAGAGGIGSLAQMGVLATMFAYTRDQEREADAIGLELMARAGYAPVQASEIWSQLLDEIRGDNASASEYANRSVLFATHPAIEDRRETLAAAAMKLPPSAAELGTGPYRQQLARFRTGFLSDELRRRRYGESLVLLDRLGRDLPDDGEVDYFRGEVYRLRAEPGDTERAMAAYEAAQARPGAPPEAFRSQGLLYRQLGRETEARAAFRRYLEQHPLAEDAEMIRTYIQGDP